MGATSEHFRHAEMQCKHCGLNECTPELLAALEAFRALVGKPVIVDSAYRCPVHNAKVGGAKSSQHLSGMAADIRVKGMTPAALEAIARRVPAIKGIGRADHQGYLHIDVREHPAQWCYGVDGKQCAYYPPQMT